MITILIIVKFDVSGLTVAEALDAPDGRTGRAVCRNAWGGGTQSASREARLGNGRTRRRHQWA